MAESSSSSTLAAELKAKHAEAAHHVEVEEVPDEDIMSHHHAEAEASSAGAKPSWAEPKAEEKSKKPEAKPLDTRSHDLFPELGGQSNSKSPAGIVPIWSAKSTTNGKTNGTNGTPRTSAPDSGVSTPTGTGQHGPPSLSIPGRNVETLYLEPQHMMPRTQMKRPLPDILKDLNRRSRAQVTMSTQGNGKLKFEAAGPQDIAAQALKELVQQIGTKQTIKVTIPQSARAHIIGKGGSTIKALQERSGARIQLPKIDESQPPVDDDDDGTIDVIVEGNAHSAAIARDLILKIAGERTANVSTKMRGIPAEFYPFIAGPKNSYAQNLEENNGVHVRIPTHNAWASQPAPSAVGPGQRPVFAPSANDNHIQLAGDRAAVQAARAEIERRVQELQRQLQLEQLSIQRGRHQFIIGNRGVPENQFFDETGCAILLPTDEDDDTVTIIGPPEQIQAGLEKAMDLATSMQCSNIDISRFHRQAPGGAATHARNVTRYLRQRKEIERLEKQYNVHFNTPFTSEGAQPWELYSRDGKAAIRAQSEIKGIVDSHPPARMSTVPVDSFFHQYLRNEVNPSVHDQYGVHLVIPDSNDTDAPVLLVYEGPSAEDTPYQIPRSQPSQAEIRNFEQGLREARKHIVDLISRQEALTSVSIDVPQKYHDKLRKFIKKEQANHAADQIPVRVSSLRETVTFRGPTTAVESLAEKSRAFVEQEKEDEKERGFTMDFDFPQKFANHLIGKGGSHIRELRDKFDVEIQVQDGKVQLKGPQKKAETAKAHILSLGKQLADETTHTLKIDPKFHRELIGAGGAQINRLQTRYKVLIFFPRSGKNAKDDESVVEGSDAGKPKRQQAPDEVIVRGPKKGADEARDEILSLLQYLRDNSFTATVSVQQKQLPSLIGQGGSGMDQLRQATGARIDIPNGRDVPEGTLVDITVKGTKDQVAAAKKILEEKRAVFDDTVVKTLDVDKQYHKALIGGGGSNLRDIVVKAGGSDDRRELARTIQFPKQDSDGNTIKIEGRKDVVDKIVAHIQEIVSQRENQVTEVVEVPAEKHRSLIGRGGDVKRGLESQFKVSLDVPRQGSGHTGVKIVGQADDVEKAKAHIQGLVKEQAGETVQVPRKMHHAISNNGQFFRRLRSDHHVSVDHAGHTIPEKPAAPSPETRGGALPLITDDEDNANDVHSWTIVELTSAEEGEIPWVLRGSPENVEKAKKAIEKALKEAKDQNATGYLVLPDPRTYRHVIGQGGSKVNSIRKQSGCKITVPRDQAGDAIEIVGSKEGVEKAKELILDAVREGVAGRPARE